LKKIGIQTFVNYTLIFIRFSIVV